jgi:hypothetical protein
MGWNPTYEVDQKDLLTVRNSDVTFGLLFTTNSLRRDKMAKTYWIVELNYDADPDYEAGAVKELLDEELKSLPGSTLVGRQIISTCMNEALKLKLRFSENIESIARA